MGKLVAFNTPRRRQPLVMISMLLNLMLLGGSFLWWSGGANGPAAGVLHGSGHRLLTSLAPAFEYAACEPAQLNKEKLEDWGCKVFNKVCFDQTNMLMYSGEKTPGHPNFTFDPVFKVHDVPSYVLPGYEEPLGSAHFTPKSWDIMIRAATPFDPPDVWQPAEFTNCTTPVVWWLTYFSIFGDLYIGSSLALDAMLAEGAYDRNVTLAPVSLGLSLPPWYQSLLGPYSRFKVTSLSELSSREHLRTGQPRCFEQAVLCNMVGMYTGSPKHHWGELRPKLAGRRAVAHYKSLHPEKFLPYEKKAEAEKGTVFRVAFMPRSKLRSIRNLPGAVEECKKWTPPADTPFKKVDCVLLPDGNEHNFVDLMAQVQNVHALVNTHGSGNNFCWFMGNGTALVEILPWNFHGKGCTWADQYFKDWYDIDHTVNSGYFRLVADKSRTFKGPYEEKNIGSTVAWNRDQDVALDFATLAKVLEKVARGQLMSTPQNFKDRTFAMTEEVICPGVIEEAKREAERIKQEEERRKQEEEEERKRQQEQAAEAARVNGEQEQAPGSGGEQVADSTEPSAV